MSPWNQINLTQASAQCMDDYSFEQLKERGREASNRFTWSLTRV